MYAYEMPLKEHLNQQMCLISLLHDMRTKDCLDLGNRELRSRTTCRHTLGAYKTCFCSTQEQKPSPLSRSPSGIHTLVSEWKTNVIFLLSEQNILLRFYSEANIGESRQNWSSEDASYLPNLSLEIFHPGSFLDYMHPGLQFWGKRLMATRLIRHRTSIHPQNMSVIPIRLVILLTWNM